MSLEASIQRAAELVGSMLRGADNAVQHRHGKVTQVNAGNPTFGINPSVHVNVRGTVIPNVPTLVSSLSVGDEVEMILVGAPPVLLVLGTAKH